MSDNNTEIPGTLKSTNPYAPKITRIVEDNNTKFFVILTDYIDGASTYIELIHELLNAKVDDEFIIVIQSCGGSVCGGTVVANAISESLATVTTIANGTCASIATTIWLAGDIIKVRPWSEVMFHMSSHGGWDNSINVKENAESIIEYMKYLLNKAIDKDVLTTDELSRIINEKSDVYIPAAIIQERIGDIE